MKLKPVTCWMVLFENGSTLVLDDPRRPKTFVKKRDAVKYTGPGRRVVKVRWTPEIIEDKHGKDNGVKP